MEISILAAAKVEYVLTKSRKINLNKLDCILKRKDPLVEKIY